MLTLIFKNRKFVMILNSKNFEKKEIKNCKLCNLTTLE